MDPPMMTTDQRQRARRLVRRCLQNEFRDAMSNVPNLTDAELFDLLTYFQEVGYLRHVGPRDHGDGVCVFPAHLHHTKD